jgi:hypothetical protein
MLNDISYDREKTVEYAREWALKRNPRYLSFDGMGGDCTNFASQCVYAGCGIMNYTQTHGWYYNNSEDRTPSWSGVEFLHDFLVANHSVGPYAEETDVTALRAGDLVQLGDASGHFYHTPVVVEVNKNGIFVAAHTFDAFLRPLNSYFYDRIRYLHIVGARQWK